MPIMVDNQRKETKLSFQNLKQPLIQDPNCSESFTDQVVFSLEAISNPVLGRSKRGPVLLRNGIHSFWYTEPPGLADLFARIRTASNPFCTAPKTLQRRSYAEVVASRRQRVPKITSENHPANCNHVGAMHGPGQVILAATGGVRTHGRVGGRFHQTGGRGFPPHW